MLRKALKGAAERGRDLVEIGGTLDALGEALELQVGLGLARFLQVERALPRRREGRQILAAGFARVSLPGK